MPVISLVDVGAHCTLRFSSEQGNILYDVYIYICVESLHVLPNPQEDG